MKLKLANICFELIESSSINLDGINRVLDCLYYITYRVKEDLNNNSDNTLSSLINYLDFLKLQETLEKL